MSEQEQHIPEKLRHMSRGDFLKLLGTAGFGGAFLWLLSRSKAEKLLESNLGTPTATASITVTTTATEFPTKPPTSAPETATPYFEPTIENTPTPIPKELLYGDLFSEETDLRKTVGAVDLTKPHELIIPGGSNVISDEKVNYQFPNPIVVENEKSWEELKPKRDKFNEWWSVDEKAMVFEGRPLTHPFVIWHAYQLKDGSRIYAGEYFRRAMEREKIEGVNPLIGKAWFIDQQGKDGKVYRSEMKFVHMAQLTADDFWASLFYSNLDDQGQIIVDHHQAWQPATDKPNERVPLIPQEHQGPQHLTLATCDHGMATIATLEVVGVKEVVNPLALISFGFRQGFAGA